MRPDDLTHRVRLEGQFELLEATRSRYHQLLRGMRSRGGHQATSALAGTVAALLETAFDVERALAVVERRRQIEAWPRDSSIVQCAQELVDLRLAAGRALRKRLSSGTTEPIGAALAALERELAQPVTPLERVRKAANAQLAASPELSRVRRFASRLSRAAGAVRDEVEALDEVAQGWSEGGGALVRCWERLRSADPSGALERSARRAFERSARQDRQLAGEGLREDSVEMLLRAEALREQFDTRLDAFIRPRIEPVRCRSEERFEVARWLMGARDTPLLSAPRAAILELGRTLAQWDPALMTPSRWRACTDSARRADSDPADPDVARLIEKVHVLLSARGLSGRRALPPLYRAHDHAGHFVSSPPLPSTLAEAMSALARSASVAKPWGTQP